MLDVFTIIRMFDVLINIRILSLAKRKQDRAEENVVKVVNSHFTLPTYTAFIRTIPTQDWR